MPEKVEVDEMFWSRAKSISVCDCLLSGDAFRFVRGKDFAVKRECASFVGTIRTWAKNKGLGVRVKIANDAKSVTAQAYELSAEDIAKRKAQALRMKKNVHGQ